MRKNRSGSESYFWSSLCLALASNRIVYQGSRLLTQNSPHYSLALPVDAAIPLLPWTISIYFGCFLFWFVMYRLIAQLPRERADRFFCANLLGKIFCLFVFLLFPTTIRRPDVDGTTVWETFIQFLYWIDAPVNLFPSLHCMIAWLCWAAVRGNKELSLLWRITALIMAILVCVSTLTTRQHVLLDVLGGILLSEISYCLSEFTVLRKLYVGLVDQLTHCVLSIRKKCCHD